MAHFIDPLYETEKAALFLSCKIIFGHNWFVQLSTFYFRCSITRGEIMVQFLPARVAKYWNSLPLL